MQDRNTGIMKGNNPALARSLFKHLFAILTPLPTRLCVQMLFSIFNFHFHNSPGSTTATCQCCGEINWGCVCHDHGGWSSRDRCTQPDSGCQSSTAYCDMRGRAQPAHDPPLLIPHHGPSHYWRQLFARNLFLFGDSAACHTKISGRPQGSPSHRSPNQRKMEDVPAGTLFSDRNYLFTDSISHKEMSLHAQGLGS